MSKPVIGAIVYHTKDFPDQLMDAVVAALRADGVRLAGVHQRRRPGSVSNCDVDMEDLASGVRFHIYQDRGKDARGCKLDTSVFADVAVEAARGLGSRPDLVLINKFGKEEAEGRGLIDVIAGAVGDGIPLLIGVPSRNLDAWRAFAGGFAATLPLERDAILTWVERVRASTGSIAVAPQL